MQTKNPETAKSAKRLSKAKQKRQRSRNREQFLKMTTTGQATHTAEDVLQGKAGHSEAIDLCEDLRKHDSMPLRTLGRIMNGEVSGKLVPTIEMTRSIAGMKGAIEAIEDSEVYNRSEKQVLKSGITGKQSSVAFRMACKPEAWGD